MSCFSQTGQCPRKLGSSGKALLVRLWNFLRILRFKIIRCLLLLFYSMYVVLSSMLSSAEFVISRQSQSIPGSVLDWFFFQGYTCSFYILLHLFLDICGPLIDGQEVWWSHVLHGPDSPDSFPYIVRCLVLRWHVADKWVLSSTRIVGLLYISMASTIAR